MADVKEQRTVRLHGKIKHYRVIQEGGEYVLQRRRHNSRKWAEVARGKSLKGLTEK